MNAITPVLTQQQLQVLARLVDLQFSAADDYPCNIDTLVEACEDSSETSQLPPLVRSEVHDAITGLIRSQLIRVEQAENGFRYQHNALETLHVGPAQLALLTTLILQGPQALQQLQQNSYRLFPFSSAEHLLEALQTLQQRSQALVKTLPGDENGNLLYCQTLCEDLTTQIPLTAPSSADTADSDDDVTLESLEARVQELESIVQRLSSEKPS